MRGRAGTVLGAADICRPRYGRDGAAYADLADIGIVGVAEIEILPIHRHAVRTVEARRRADAVIAALLEQRARDDSQ